MYKKTERKMGGGPSGICSFHSFTDDLGLKDFSKTRTQWGTESLFSLLKFLSGSFNWSLGNIGFKTPSDIKELELE